MQPTVNYALRVAIYDIKGTILGKSVRNNSAYDGLVQLINYVIFFKLYLKSFLRAPSHYRQWKLKMSVINGSL